MRISDLARAGALVLAGLALAACDPAMMAGGSPTRTRVSVGGQPVVIAAPAGFCVDRKSTRMTSEGAFVLMSDCALLGGPSISGRAPVGAALTASVSTAGLGGEGDAADSMEDLEAFAATAEGRAVMSRSGQSSRVRIVNTQIHDGVLFVLVEDRGRMPVPGLDRQFWRAFLEVDGRIVALSQLGFEGAGLTAQDGLDQLAGLARAIQVANPG